MTTPTTTQQLRKPGDGVMYRVADLNQHTPAHRLHGYDGTQPVVCDGWRPTGEGHAVDEAGARELNPHWCFNCCADKYGLAVTA